MKKLIFLISIFFTIFFVGCKEEKNDPERVVKDFLESFYTKDFVKLKELSTTESKQNIDFINIMNGMTSVKKSEPAKFSPDNFKYGKPEINGNEANIEVTDIASGFKTTYYLKDEDGWKVSFTLNSILKGLQQNDSTGNSLPPEFFKAIEKYKNVNLDSITKVMNENFKKLSHSQKDSIKEAVNNTVKEFSNVPPDSIISVMQKKLKSIDSVKNSGY